jgi:hypothetical protein
MKQEKIDPLRKYGHRADKKLFFPKEYSYTSLFYIWSNFHSVFLLIHYIDVYSVCLPAVDLEYTCIARSACKTRDYIFSV